MDRSNNITVPDDTPWLNDPAVRRVCEAISSEGNKIYFVGGCVRDALLGVKGSDVDLATDATPQEVTRLARAKGLKVVPTGIDHGTVTVVADGVGYEITTFRSDVKTDGRYAKVSFTTDIARDAVRRDFTLNALYANGRGQVIDPLGEGVADCLARRIRFIRDARARIQEDYLRILRFFRFHAWYAGSNQGFDADALAAIAQSNDGLETLSAERIGMEICKTLSAPDPAPALATMLQVGALHRVLPGSDTMLLGPVVHLEECLLLDPNWRYRLTALGGQDAKSRLRLSSKDAKTLDRINSALGENTSLSEVAYREGIEIATGVLILRAALSNQPLTPSSLEPIRTAVAARFPLTAKDLMPEVTGKALGQRLAHLEQLWIASDFRLTRDELMKLS